MKRLYTIAALILVALLSAPAEGQDRDKVTPNTVLDILQTVDSSLEPGDVKVRMIKHLNTRVKVNLTYKGDNAVLYLKWKRVRNLYRWWFERDYQTSLVVVSERAKSLRDNAPLMDRESAAEKPNPEMKERPDAGQDQEPEPELPDAKVVKQNTVEEKPSESAYKPPVEKDETEDKKEEPVPQPEAVLKAADKEKQEKATAEKESAVNPGKPQETAPPVESAQEKETPAPAEPEKEMKAIVEASEEKAVAPEQEERKQGPPKPEEAKAAGTPAPQELPSEKQALIRKDSRLTDEPESKPEPVAEQEKTDEPEEKATVVRRDSRLTDTPGETQPEPEPVPVEEPEPANASPFVPVEVATGPEGTARQFISNLIVTLGKGEEEKYSLYLLREDEMTEGTDSNDYNRGKTLWLDQMREVNARLKGAKQVRIERVVLQTPQTAAIERNTIQSLERRVTRVDRVYTYVRVRLLVDGESAYLTIGGLMRTPNGWRIGGRLEYLTNLALQ